MDNRPVGVFDSGIGGLSLVSEVKRQLPGEGVVYIADVERQPFGEKSAQEVIRISREIADELLRLGAKAIVVACSTATAVALPSLRESCGVPVVGIITDRLVDDICRATRTKKIGIISTELTAKSGSFKKAIEAADPSLSVCSAACSELVNMISEGQIFDERIVKAVDAHIAPLLAQGADTLVLGCTHFNFIADIIAPLVSRRMTVISPPEATVAALAGILDERGLRSGKGGNPSYRYLSTGDTESFTRLVRRLWRDGGGAGIEHFDWVRE
ncbi:MAG TPA: glutamate racemase [bacterium]|nr:glutamate racemase [bacterium]